MNISDILRQSTWNAPIPQRQHPLTVIKSECSSFLHESAGSPIYKNITTSSSPISAGMFKIKVRHKKSDNTPISMAYNSAFTQNLREKAVFAYSNITLCEQNDSLCYVFPKNGYKFLYSKEITHSNEEYKGVLDSLIENVDMDKAYTIITDMLKFTYTDKNLNEGIQSEAEIILYHLPYFYAVSTKRYPDYNSLLKTIGAA